jgi:Cu+-exporting ATPase
MAVDPATAAATADHGGSTYPFCSVGCRDAFVRSPSDFLGAAPTDRHMH